MLHILSLCSDLQQTEVMATRGKKDDREAELEAALEAIRKEAWKPGQTLPKLRHAISLILQELKR